MWTNLTTMSTYSINRQTRKWAKKQFFHLQDLSVPNSFIFHTSCGSKLSHGHSRLLLVRDLVQEWWRVCLNHRQPNGEDKHLPPANWLDLMHGRANTGPWQENKFGVTYVPWKIKNKDKIQILHPHYNVGLCASLCFMVYHKNFTFLRLTKHWNEQNAQAK
jgi:hypothetical protein